MGKLIHGKEFLNWLISQDIIPERARRVVIDADVDGPVIIYTEQFGTKGLVESDIPPELYEGITINFPGRE